MTVLLNGKHRPYYMGIRRHDFDGRGLRGTNPVIAWRNDNGNAVWLYVNLYGGGKTRTKLDHSDFSEIEQSGTKIRELGMWIAKIGPGYLNSCACATARGR